MKKQRVLVLFDTAGPPPDDQDFSADLATEDWKTERHILRALDRLGHETHRCGIYDDLGPLDAALARVRPDIVFNLVEHFGGDRSLDRAIAGYLELKGVPSTGSKSAGMLLCRDKGLAKTILGAHRIQTPRFAIFPRARKVHKPAALSFPLFVKPVREDASLGISQASVVEDEGALVQRVRFIHEQVGDDALAEHYIDGREFYASILGNDRLTVFPLREMTFGDRPEDEPKIATYKAKWDAAYRKRWRITTRFVPNLPDETRQRIERICKRTYRLLRIRGWGRIDLRLTAEGRIVVLEANPNPFLAKDEDYADSAMKGGLSYEALIGRILALGLKS